MTCEQMKSIFLSNERVRLRAVEPEDIELLHAVENDTSLWDISNTNVPYSRYILREYLKNTQYDLFADKQLRLVIERKSDCVPLGIIDITDFMPIHSRGEVGIVIRKACRREGYGTDALRLLCDYAFGFLRLNQLYAQIAVGNTACIRLFASCGFVQCGVLREWQYIDGQYRDVLLFQYVDRK